MEKFITLDHLKKTAQSLILDTDSKINGLPRVAQTGSYNDLINKPTIPEDNEDFIVNISQNEDIYTADKTFLEIKTAIDGNKRVYCRYSISNIIYYFTLIRITSSFILFVCLNLSNATSTATIKPNCIKINSDNSIEHSNAVSLLTPKYIATTINQSSTNNYVAGAKAVYDAIPTATSSLTNDSGYQTSSDVQTAINTAIGNINSFDVEIAASTSAVTTPNSHTIYFIPQAVNSSVHDEYMYINNNWELIGTTSIDLSGYLQSSDIADWAKASTKPSYTASEVGALPDTYTAPVTSVNGATGTPKTSFYVTINGNAVSGNTADKTFDQVAAAYEAGYAVYAINGTSIFYLSLVRYTEEQISNISFSRTGGSQIYTFGWAKNSNNISYTSVNLGNYVRTTTTINNKALTSDITLTASDVGALPDTTVIPAAQVQSDWNATTGMGVILNKPTIPTVTNTYSASSSDAMSGIAVNSAISTAIQNINTTYSLSISGNVITLTGSDNTTSSITLPVYNGGVS